MKILNIKRILTGAVNRLQRLIDQHFFRAAFFVGYVYWHTMPSAQMLHIPKSPYDHWCAGRRRLASGKLASMVPILIGESAPATLGGVPSWLLDFATEERPFVPPLDGGIPDPSAYLLICTEIFP